MSKSALNNEKYYKVAIANCRSPSGTLKEIVQAWAKF